MASFVQEFLTDAEQIKQLPSGVKVTPLKDSQKFSVEVKPANDLRIESPETFEVHLDNSFPVSPPKIKNSRGQPVNLRITRNESCLGWNQNYTLLHVVFSIRHFLKKLRKDLVPKFSLPTGHAINSRMTLKMKSSSCERQGHRRTMEDRMLIIDEIEIKNRNLGMWIVFDGHGGTSASSFCSRVFLDKFKRHYLTNNMCEAARLTVLEIDKLFLEAAQNGYACGRGLPNTPKVTRHDKSGATCCAIIYDEPNLAFVNVGDSGAILCRGGEAISMTRDHKATCPDELARIVAEGGFVARARVLGQLSVSRALGDAEFKHTPLVICDPEIQTMRISEKDDFAIVACDGLWDVFSPQTAVDFVLQAVEEHHDWDLATTQLVEHAINELGSCDNVSCIIIKFNQVKRERSLIAGLSRNSVGKVEGLQDLNTSPRPPMKAASAYSHRSWAMSPSPSQKPNNQRHVQSNMKSNQRPQLQKRIIKNNNYNKGPVTPMGSNNKAMWRRGRGQTTNDDHSIDDLDHIYKWLQDSPSGQKVVPTPTRRQPQSQQKSNRSNNRMTPKAPQYPSKATPHHRNRANNNNGPMNSVARNGRPPQSGMKSNSKQKTKYTRLNSKAMERHESSTYSVDSVDEAKDVFQVSGDLDDILNSLGANDPSRTPPVGAVLNYPNNIMRHLDDPNTNNKTEEEILEMMLR
eukprot:TRINITY_DN190462_c0_g1_i2.p1 TRINITY_DN190462_c0_g1~~TRINITY_DN190462_c0_g1_i2.p1  ORF type:complete len:688 (+),score=163.38 TRINITY_DN190462_c0_g1_i2:58-2121(+)